MSDDELHGFRLIAVRCKCTNDVLGNDLRSLLGRPVSLFSQLLNSLTLRSFVKRGRMAGIVTITDTIVITVTAPMASPPFLPLPEQFTSTTESSTFYECVPDVPEAPETLKSGIAVYVTAAIGTVFAVLMFASLMAYLRRSKMDGRRLRHEN